MTALFRPPLSNPCQQISERSDSPKELSFGWQRASLLGAFFNGVFLLALGVSILLQSIERFVSLQRKFRKIPDVSSTGHKKY